MKPLPSTPGQSPVRDVRSMVPYAILFPGQGSQRVGMGADVRDTMPELLGQSAVDVLGWDLDGLIAEGPEEELTRTEHAQPALYAVSYALWSSLAEATPHPPAAAAGHSLGEYTALAAAGVFDYMVGLDLVAKRGAAMADAAQLTSSGMAALLGADAEQAEAICAERRSGGGALYVANINAPGQIVVAGGDDDLNWLVDNARDIGIRRAIRLKVAGGFHSPFMAAAAAALGRALDDVTMAEGRFPVYANVSAAPARDPREELRAQLTAPVRFAASLMAMNEAGIGTFVHVGPGDVTAGLAKRTLPDATIHTVSTIAEARAVGELLSVE